MEIKNGKLYSNGNIQAKVKTNSNTRETLRCTDWYLVTTYYYSDGTTYETWEYLGTTCDGCDDPMYQSLCPDNGGSGGGGGGATDPVEQPDYFATESAEQTIYATTQESTPDGPSSSSVSVRPEAFFRADISWGFSYRTMTFTYFNPKPAVVEPPKVVYLDNDLLCETHWNILQSRNLPIQLLTPKSFRCVWNIDYQEAGFYGPLPYGPYTFFDQMSKVCAAP